MTDNEIILINIIRENENPEKALAVSLELILKYLERPESFE